MMPLYSLRSWQRFAMIFTHLDPQRVISGVEKLPRRLLLVAYRTNFTATCWEVPERLNGEPGFA
jgi:hypothetical protein